MHLKYMIFSILDGMERRGGGANETVRLNGVAFAFFCWHSCFVRDVSLFYRPARLLNDAVFMKADAVYSDDFYYSYDMLPSGEDRAIVVHAISHQGATAREHGRQFCGVVWHSG
jgi:hypothetical protein